MTDRADYVLSLTNGQRIAVLVRLAAVHPDVFDEIVRQDPVRQRAMRAHLERRAREGDNDSGEGSGHG